MHVISSHLLDCPLGCRDRRARVKGAIHVTSVDDLWYLADRAEQRAEQAYHRATDRYDTDCLERTYRKHVSRSRFRTLAERIQESGTPYGAHTLVHRDSEELLLVRHDGVDLWVLPGGGVDGSETFQETAKRELEEEAGVNATYRGLTMLNRVEINCRGYDTWGVLPVFQKVAETTDPTVSDPDGEISAARWFQPSHLPEDTRDRSDLIDAAQTIP